MFRASLKKGDGTDLKEADLVSPVNLFLQSIFSQVDIYLQQRLCSSGSAGHPYRAMFDTLLNFGPPALESQFQSQLYYKDTAGAMDANVPKKSPVNEGLDNRYRLSKLSQ